LNANPADPGKATMGAHYVISSYLVDVGGAGSLGKQDFILVIERGMWPVMQVYVIVSIVDVQRQGQPWCALPEGQGCGVHKLGISGVEWR
jgi:hypothetical protein